MSHGGKMMDSELEQAHDRLCVLNKLFSLSKPVLSSLRGLVTSMPTSSIAERVKWDIQVKCPSQ